MSLNISTNSTTPTNADVGSSCSNKTSVLRVLLVTSLVAAAGVCAGVAYDQLSKSEANVAILTFNSIADAALARAKANALQKLDAAAVMATLFAWQFPDADQWPFVEMAGYIPLAASLAKLSGSGIPNNSYTVVVPPEKIDELLEHNKGVVERAGCPEGSGSSDFGYGVWKIDKSNPKQFDDGRINATDGMNAWGGEDPNLSVLLLNNDQNCPIVNYDVYSEKFRGIHIDAMRECSADHPEDPIDCFTTTDIQFVLYNADDPAAILYHPIYPINNPGEFVGFIASLTIWSTVLQDIVPAYVDGIMVVLESETQAYTYEMREGTAYVVGKGDLHDANYDMYKAGPITLNDYKSYSNTSSTYSLSIYPTAIVFQEFETNTPTVVAVSLVAVICVVASLFFVYDLLVRREIRALKEQSDRYKQKFGEIVKSRPSTCNIDLKSKTALEILFNKLDKDGNGTVDRDELKLYVGDTIEEKDFEAMWENIDLDKNG
eukprot:CAMPEP_0181139862 /NCGR_PEP_ID=MMETSP1071-20121207/35004_1 /TAXON_ID=35127 /ORGANISM="Thalassiosira sp., Strain NH16" /LENGTH=488 /DNA_ID=CAMNT_0023226789 /DNA_START=34 /DNA_END=1497 /DNA_ORIENTATION=-